MGVATYLAGRFSTPKIAMKLGSNLITGFIIGGRGNH